MRFFVQGPGTYRVLGLFPTKVRLFAVDAEHGLGGRDKRVRVHDVGPIPAPMQALLGCD